MEAMAEENVTKDILIFFFKLASADLKSCTALKPRCYITFITVKAVMMFAVMDYLQRIFEASESLFSQQSKPLEVRSKAKTHLKNATICFGKWSAV